MAVPTEVAAEILAKCARHCCVCRRFRPLHLQVHHIIERSEGGTDDPDNLIAICVSCHSDTHTETKLTRRFSVKELKLHRDAVYQLVSDGKLPAPDVGSEPLATLSANIIELLRTAQADKSDDPDELPIMSLEILLAAVAEKATIELRRSEGGIFISVARRPPWTRVCTKPVHYPDEIVKLLALGLIDGTSDKLFVTEAGVQFADDVLSTKPLFTLKKAKCLQCSLHFVLCTWEPERHSAKSLYCPECGQHHGRFLVWQQQQRGFIFQMVPGSAQMEGFPTT